MMYPLIRCCHPDEGRTLNYGATSHVFFILSRGNNAGKPSLTPWANSFTVICPHQEYFDYYYWLVNALHQAGKFRTHHRGSVIPFINVNDVRHLIRQAALAIHQDWKQFRELVTTLDNLSQLRSTLQQQIEATEKLQQCLLTKYFGN